MPVSNLIDNPLYEPFVPGAVADDAKADPHLKLGSRDLHVSVLNTVYEPAQLARRSESVPGRSSSLARSSTATMGMRDAWQKSRALNMKGAELLAYVTSQQQKKEQTPPLPERLKGGSLGHSVERLAPGYDVVRNVNPRPVDNAYSVVAIDQLNFSEERIELLDREIESAQGKPAGPAPGFEPFYYEYEAVNGSEPVYDQTPDSYYEEVDELFNHLSVASVEVEQTVAPTPESEAFYNDPAELDGSHELNGEGLELLQLLQSDRSKRSGIIVG